MKDVAVIAKPPRRTPDPEEAQEIKQKTARRIQQLLVRNRELRLQLAYMQLVTAQLMLMIPKKAVSDILEAAAKKLHASTKG